MEIDLRLGYGGGKKGKKKRKKREKKNLAENENRKINEENTH